MARPSKRAIALRHARASKKRRIASGKQGLEVSGAPSPLPVEDPEVPGAPSPSLVEGPKVSGVSSPLPVEGSGVSGAPNPLLVEDSDLNYGSTSKPDAQREILLSEGEGGCPVQIGQPVTGWGEVEIGLYGYSNTRVYRQKTFYHKNKEEITRKRKAKQASNAGIPATERPKPIWGDVSQMFVRASKHTTGSSPTGVVLQPEQPPASTGSSPPA